MQLATARERDRLEVIGQRAAGFTSVVLRRKENVAALPASAAIELRRVAGGIERRLREDLVGHGHLSALEFPRRVTQLLVNKDVQHQMHDSGPPRCLAIFACWKSPHRRLCTREACSPRSAPMSW